MSLTSYKTNGQSGSKTATISWEAVVSPGSGEVNGHLLIMVDSGESGGVEVRFSGSTDGIFIEPGEKVSLLCDDLAKVEVRRQDTNAEFRYWAF